MTKKTILLDCPFCLNQTVCSCCGQCVNPDCGFKHENLRYDEMSNKYHYDQYVKTRTEIGIKIKPFKEWLADLDRFKTKYHKVLFPKKE